MRFELAQYGLWGLLSLPNFHELQSELGVGVG
jgi:hypothetical protein